MKVKYKNAKIEVELTEKEDDDLTYKYYGEGMSDDITDHIKERLSLTDKELEGLCLVCGEVRLLIKHSKHNKKVCIECVADLELVVFGKLQEMRKLGETFRKL